MRSMVAVVSSILAASIVLSVQGCGALRDNRRETYHSWQDRAVNGDSSRGSPWFP